MLKNLKLLYLRKRLGVRNEILYGDTGAPLHPTKSYKFEF